MNNPTNPGSESQQSRFSGEIDTTNETCGLLQMHALMGIYHLFALEIVRGNSRICS